MTVLEILETIEPTPDLIAACRKLKALGFRLALDDFIWKPKFEPLIDLANYIKVDFSISNAAERQDLMRRLSHRAVAMLAEKVETQQEYQQARSEGFTLFQGYYFCRPVLLKSHKIPPNSLFYIEILQLLQSNPIELHKLSRLVKRDASLTYRLLRLVNSPMCAIRQEINSIQTALIAVGEDTFRRLATLAITSELNASQPAEILRMAFVRARFCELAAGLCSLNPTEQYLLGMMSMLSAMLGLSMDELAPTLPLRDPIRHALQGQDVPERVLLYWLECHEHCDWQTCDSIIQSCGLNQEDLLRFYEEAILWSESALRATP
jgi:EAL and modified HD-GYP domain-containing signal transduction protein